MQSQPCQSRSLQIRRFPVLLSAAAGSLFWCGIAAANSVNLTLQPSDGLNNVEDIAGVTQYEAGSAFDAAGKVVATYVIVRRATTGFSSPINSAAETITLVVAATANSRQQDVGLQGSHSIVNGNFLGSVDAASQKYHFMNDATASATYDGATHLQLSWSSAASFP